MPSPRLVISRRRFFKTGLTALSLPVLGFPTTVAGPAADPGLVFEPGKNVIPAPDNPGDWPEFVRLLHNWRTKVRTDSGYADALYRRPDFAWVTRNFSCCFLMLCDETFYDRRTGRYTVKSFLEHGQREFGGYDSIVLWHAYPRIGLDDRNQFDFYRDAPGGLKGLRRVVDELHRGRVRVFLDYNPWDTRTRREGRDDVDALAELVRVLDADGIFLDTLDRGAGSFRAKLDAVRRGVVLESEIALPLDRIHDHHASWAQWFGDRRTPGVLRNKWFERRHLQHQIARWNTDHSGELHQAWMNGSGMMVWENVFGSWVGWNERDRSILRAMLPIQRRFSALFAGEGWTPLVPVTAESTFASRWEKNAVRLWTLVNRADREVEGRLLTVETGPKERVFDLVEGREIGIPDGPRRPMAPSSDPSRNKVDVKGRIPGRGIGCIVVMPAAEVTAGFRRFLRSQAALVGRARWSTTFPARAVRRFPVQPTAPRLEGGIPPDMALIPGMDGELETEFRARECGFLTSTAAEFLDGWKVGLHRPFRLKRRVAIRPFAMDHTPVTNAAFAKFLRASGYRPRHRERFLAHWVDEAPPPGLEEHPVVCVDLNDARAFARWAGKRLPTDEEWQIAAQGPAGWRYPWGNDWAPGRCNEGATSATTPVTAFPQGRTPAGLYDLCGNVWHWTESEHSDGRTRFALLRGGSFYRRGGSDWYFDEGPQPTWFAAKMLLMGPGLDRCANIGFRCVKDRSRS